MLDVLQGSEYASGLVLGVLIVLVYCCGFICRYYLIDLQTLTASFFGQLWLAASFNKWDPAYSTISGLIVGGGLIVVMGW